jgi:hypothetical protein
MSVGHGGCSLGPADASQRIEQSPRLCPYQIIGAPIAGSLSASPPMAAKVPNERSRQRRGHDRRGSHHAPAAAAAVGIGARGWSRPGSPLSPRRPHMQGFGGRVHVECATRRQNSRDARRAKRPWPRGPSVLSRVTRRVPGARAPVRAFTARGPAPDRDDVG